jgi:hypothetical protein
MSDEKPASFAVLLEQANARKEHPVARRMLDKVRCRALLVEIGAPVVERFELIESIDRLTPSMLQRPTVVKPRRGFNNRGVAALVPLGDGYWREMLSGVVLDFEGVRGRLAAAALRHTLPDAWIVEDLVEGESPGVPVDDVKLCMFGEQLACSFVRSNGPRGYRWFDADWQPVDTGVHPAHLEPSIPAPAARDHLAEIARTISARLPVPFVRVDFLVGHKQIVVGELTPYPGWYLDFTPEWDQTLGMLYSRSDAALRASGRDVTRVDPVVTA